MLLFLDFQNSLTGQNTFASEEEFEITKKMMQTKYGVDSFRSWGYVYGIFDVKPMLNSIILLGNLYRDR